MSDNKSDVLVHEFSGAVLKLLLFINSRYDKEHSLAYTLEDALTNGLKAVQRSKEYSEETKNRKLYDKELAADPSVVLHPERMLALMRKYKIGASNANFETDLMKAAEELQKVREAEKAAKEAAELAALEVATKPEPTKAATAA